MDADEPEAMLVEIEDDTLETTSVATPIVQMQIPIFKFEFANRDLRWDQYWTKLRALDYLIFRHDRVDCLRAVGEILEVFENANNSILDIYKTSEVSITSIKANMTLKYSKTAYDLFRSTAFNQHF